MQLRDLLSIPSLYSAFYKIVSGRLGEFYVSHYLRPRHGNRILDIGCGPANILEFLPEDIQYVGFDASPEYINSARRRFGARGTFHCALITRELVSHFSGFDIAIANGVLHHLDDRAALDLLEIARAALRPGGRLVTLDGCYLEGQSRIARYLLEHDRGKFVRNRDDYEQLVLQVFKSVSIHIHCDLIRIPYNHIIMECDA